MPAERQHRGDIDDQWTFITRISMGDSATAKKQTDIYLYNRAQHLNTAGRVARIPSATSLDTKHVVILGLGAIGHHLALDLGRAGVGHLTLVDQDVIDCTGSGARQPAPITHAGIPKATFFKDTITPTSPTITIDTHHIDLTDLQLGGESDCETESLRLLAALVKADLVIDATAHRAVTRYVAATCHRAQTPFLHVSATAGAWGGIVALLTEGTGCWACVEHWRHDPTRPLQVPPADPDGWVNPPGCAEATFTGTGADLAAVANHANRIALAHLTAARDLGGDYHVAELITLDGIPQPAAWSSTRLPIHPDCPRHATAPNGERP